MREKLIEIMKKWGSENTDSFPFESVADCLLENGVVVLPFPIGTTYYRIVTKRAKADGTYFKFILKANLNWYNVEGVLSDFGKSVFLTKEEAEKALAEAMREE